jgi:PPIC-type peptidyl-prolyl cis-trans isomerase-like protein
MLPSTRAVLRALVVPPALVALVACAAAGPPPAATVAGSDITNDQLATTAGVFKAVADLQQQPCGQTDGETDTPEAACNRFSLGALIQFREADLYAGAHQIAVADDKIQKSLDSFERSVGADRLTQQLDANGVTLDDVRELIRLSLLQGAVAKAVTAERLTDERLRQRYRDSIGDYTTLHVDHILVNTQAEAEKVYQQVTTPGFTLQDFQALAKQVSTDPNAAKDGGELTLPESQLVSEFTAAAEHLRPGEISRPVQTQYGWHVIWMIGKDVTPYEQAKSQILQSASAQEFQTWMQEQAPQVQVDPSFGRYDAQQLLVVRIASTDPSATQSPPASPVNATPSP